MQKFIMPRRTRNKIETIFGCLKSTKYTYAILLCMILITIVWRRDTLVQRIRNNNIYEEVDKTLHQSNDRPSHIVQHFNQNENKRSEIVNKMAENKKKPDETEHFDERYKNPKPPWDRSDSNDLKNEDRPILNKKRWVKSVNCAKIISGSTSEILKTKKLENDYLEVLSPFYYQSKAQNCKKFLSDRHYITEYLSDEEVNFPLAYSIVIYKSVYQFERLLRTIYRPQNYYCIHADVKMNDNDYRAISSILKCFSNVFLASSSFDVTWGNFTVLAADLVCMKDLMKYKKWKYFINLTGQEFPLKTNQEIVKILKSYKGANDVNINLEKDIDWTERWKKVGPPPNGITPYKGAVHVAANREFVKYAISNKTAISLLKWTKDIYIPDETFFTTLNHNPQLGIPGTFNGILSKKNYYTKGDMVRFKKWKPTGDFPCAGIKPHGICIASVVDLPSLSRRPEMFVNKVFWDYDHYAMDCLEEHIHNRTVDGYYGIIKFNLTRYSNLYFVRRAVKL